MVFKSSAAVPGLQGLFAYPHVDDRAAAVLADGEDLVGHADRAVRRHRPGDPVLTGAVLIERGGVQRQLRRLRRGVRVNRCAGVAIFSD